MSYSTRPGGYGGPPQPSNPGYGPQSPGYGAAPGATEGKHLPFYLNVGVVALGVISFLLGFAPYISGASAEFGGESISVSSSANFFMTNGLLSISLLLAAALVAGLGMLPKQEIHEGVVASLSIVGFVSLLLQLINLPGEVKLGFGLITVLITSFLQSALAVAALLFSADVIKPPGPKEPQYGYYGQGGYGQLPPQSQPPQSQPQQPYYAGGPAPGSYPPPPSQPQQPQW